MCRSCRIAVSRMLRHTIFGTTPLPYAARCPGHANGPPGTLSRGPCASHDPPVSRRGHLNATLTCSSLPPSRGLGDGHRRARAGHLGGRPRVRRGPVAVRVAVVERRDRRLRRDEPSRHRCGGRSPRRCASWPKVASNGWRRLPSIVACRRRSSSMIGAGRASTGSTSPPPGWSDGVVVAVLTVGEPDEHAVLVREALHPVGLGVAPAEVVRAGLQGRVVAAVDAVLGEVEVLHLLGRRAVDDARSPWPSRRRRPTRRRRPHRRRRRWSRRRRRRRPRSRRHRRWRRGSGTGRSGPCRPRGPTTSGPRRTTSLTGVPTCAHVAPLSVETSP